VSEIAQTADVSLNVADYANVDAAGKVNILGGGVAGLGFEPSTGLTSRFTLVVSVHLPTALLPAEFSLEIFLTKDGELVMAPGPVEPQAVRISQAVTLDPPMAFQQPGRGHVGNRHGAVLDFNNGLPLSPGGLYLWNVRIDGDTSKTWTYPFAVAGLAQGIVFG